MKTELQTGGVRGAKSSRFALLCLCWMLSALTATAQTDKQRVFVLTDISNEPDDEESMVRFLVYANEYDIEGLVATTSTWLRNTTRVDLIHRQLGAYAQVRDNLLKHAPGFPTAESLRAVTAVGQLAYGMAAVGEGKSTAGSRRLLATADKADERPLWVTVWGGANTLAQASMKLGEAMYKQQAEADAAKDAAKDDVVDAEFTEVDDDKKSA